VRQAVIYLRVSTIEQTTANQERELRDIASRMGCEIVKVYRDHGISGAKGRDKRPAFDKLCRDAATGIRHGHGVVGRPVRTQPAGHGFLSELHALKIDLFLRQQGRICRVRARHDSGTRPRRACKGQEQGEASWSASDSPCAGENESVRLW